MKRTCAAVVWSALGAAVLAQQAQFSSRVEVVSIVATVLDDAGAAVTGLGADAFSIQEDGRTRPITSFVSERVPFSLVVALDTSRSMDGDRFRFAREAVSVLASDMEADDQLAIVGFATSPYLIAPWTGDAGRVLSTLAAVKPDGSTALYDGVREALDVAKYATHRRAAIVVISDGDDNPLPRNPMPTTAGSGLLAEELRALRENALLEQIRRSDALLYGIRVSAPARYLGGSTSAVDLMGLARLAEPSGGFSQVVASASAVPAAARVIREQLNQRYILGFVPEHESDGKFHRLRVTVRGCKCRVRARSGFVAAAPSDRSERRSVR